MSFVLLTRDEFRSAVFARDNNKCVVCGAPAKDAHHIMERRLWGDGGYYIENGASLCSVHHLAAESTVLSCHELRERIGIKKFPLPEHLYNDQEFDKWGNPILANGLRLKGELYDDASVQIVLQPVLALFTDRVKYPRSYHLPWSPGATDDDRVLKDVSHFVGQEVVVTVKLDGECSSFYTDYYHARSTEYESHPSRTIAKTLHAQIAHDIPKGWRVCGENLFAKHSIHYKNLPAYFLVFSIWNEKNIALSWYDTKEWAELLGLQTVPELYRGPWDEVLIRGLFRPEFNGDPMEGYVVRVTRAFHYKEFRNCLAKYVRKNHVAAETYHWKFAKVEPNLLKK
jgi:hypothetical protein